MCKIRKNICKTCVLNAGYFPFGHRGCEVGHTGCEVGTVGTVCDKAKSGSVYWTK
jgi:hypothetical protein